MTIATRSIHLLIAALAVGSSAVIAGDHIDSSLLHETKVTKEAAIKTALAKVPGGTIKSTELEKEKGKIVWSFDISTKGSPNITEVLVDAVTGKIASVEKETPAQQQKEAAQDKAEKAKASKK